jgi:hypothetical protein
MTEVSSIIQQSLRESNVIALGAVPKAPQSAEALTKLQSIVSSVFGNEVGEDLQPWPLGNFGRSQNSKLPWSENELRYPSINSALVAVNEAAMTVYLPTNPSDGARFQIVDPLSRLATAPVTLDANGRAIEGGLTLLLNANGLNRSWLFRSDLASWVRITDLDADGDFPFPREFDDYFVVMLAMRLNPGYGKSLDEQSVARLKAQKRQITARYVQSAPLETNTDISYATRQSYNNWADAWFGGGSQQAWNRGGYF